MRLSRKDAEILRLQNIKKILEYEIDGTVYTIVIAYPVTGRTHQLRVHFHIGHPIAGDRMYAPECMSENSGMFGYNASPPKKIISRQALHALSLNFVTYSENKNIEVYAPIPDDMKKNSAGGALVLEYIKRFMN